MNCFICLSLLILYITPLLLVNGAQKRYWYPEYRQRADEARSVGRDKVVLSTLKDAAGIYHNKTKGRELGHDKTVLATVVSYNEKMDYKPYFHNLLCFVRHHDIDIVVYFLQYNMSDSDPEIKSITNMGIKVLPYPKELFWTLMYSKSNEIQSGPNRLDFSSDVPSFKSHGPLVKLLPVLEILLLGYNSIFFDVDTALVVDPVPFLTRGQSDFVSAIEMRTCPDYYTPTYFNASELHKEPRAPRANIMEESNWHTIEPNTGTIMVRSTEAGIGFYTEWLLRIVRENDGNVQKLLRKDPETAHYSRDCLYGDKSGGKESSKHAFRYNKRFPGNNPQAQTPRRALRKKKKPKSESPNLPSLPAQIGQPSPSSSLLPGLFANIFPGRTGSTSTAAHAPRHHHAAPVHRRNIAALRARWESNYTTLVEDITSGDFQKPAKFCFLSELLFQNGHTAFDCAVKPTSKDSYILEMYKNGLKTSAETGNAHMVQDKDTMKSSSHARFPVSVHANSGEQKTQELSARGLWLVQNDSPEVVFNASTCRAYDPYQTHAGRFNWSQEVAEITHKRQSLFDASVVPGGLIQSTTGIDVYYVNEHKQKQLFPDGDTFVAKVGPNKWGAVRFLPQGLMDLVPTGEPFPSVIAPPAPVVSVAAPAPAAASNVIAPAATVSEPSKAGVNVTSPSLAPPVRIIRVDGKNFFDAPPVAADAPVVHKEQEPMHKQIVPGMLVRAPGSQMVYYIDRHLFRRKVPSMQVFHRLFGARHYDIVTLPEKAVMKLRPGEPLV